MATETHIIPLPYVANTNALCGKFMGPNTRGFNTCVLQLEDTRYYNRESVNCDVCILVAFSEGIMPMSRKEFLELYNMKYQQFIQKRRAKK